MALIIKDIGEIWTRLFDHRPFLSGEIKFFLREFEEKRSDREIEGLFQILESVTDIRDSQIDRVTLAAETHLPSLKINILESVNKCNDILLKEQIYRATIQYLLTSLPFPAFVTTRLTRKQMIFDKLTEGLSSAKHLADDKTLERNRELRKVEWENFIQDMAKKCQKVDETFKEKEDDIRDFYFDLERKLHISPVDLDKS